ncbi:ADP-ribosylglycohydrolase family protein [Stratiformator vulcanicus]|uniref:ADP-ribosylglycohydrolase n=1 Tax=Stratiformator vulcanicus TaxID=2527980 RepID=A0A517QXC5_9PLAN|nr:ADP-ribosylglycohydrolase family protein [Stratiformator vulcanicus]QDT36238.1 ADP-ribosylglycohydrolase [Stratiformator vulcanicus]
MNKSKICLLMLFSVFASMASAGERDQTESFEIPAHVLKDKIRGGLLGQLLGNLNGLPHEMKYVDEPGSVEGYTPSLPEGARTDDDTDFEWVYIVAMQDEGKIFLPHERITELWTARINRAIWCSNLYARRLMDLGIDPPMTGSIVLNPWADFNISGQFLCETFALTAPGMPQTASKIGLHYTRVAIDDEPAQTTQLFCTMIALAFVVDDLEVLLDRGVEAIDPKSLQREIIADVRGWHQQYPDDWRQTRRLLKEKYTQADGGMRDRNGYELTTGSTVAALLYGEGDLPKTLEIAFNFGWDCDNSAATAGAIVGVMKGYRSFLAQEWQIVDRYRNTTREGMPNDETITSFADRLVELAERIVLDAGGERRWEQGSVEYQIKAESPANIRALESPKGRTAQLAKELGDEVRTGILNPKSDRERARAAYLAICLKTAPTFAAEHPEQWAAAVAALNEFQPLVQYLFSDRPLTPMHHDLKRRATAAGLVVKKQ